MSFFSSGRSLAVECNKRQGVLFLDLDTGRARRKVAEPFVESYNFYPPRLSPDQKWLIWTDKGNLKSTILRCFEMGSNEEVASSITVAFSDPWMLDHEIRISPDSTSIAVGCHPNRVRLFSVPGLEEVGVLEVGGEVKSVAWSPDSQTLAVAVMFPNVTELWDVASRKRISPPLQGTQRAPGIDLCFSPDQSLLAVAGDLETVVVWNLQTRTEQAVYLHDARSVVFLPDGKTLATGGRDGAVKLWDTTRSPETALQKARTSEILRIEFSPDGRLLATTAADGVARVFDSASEGLVAELLPEGSQVDRSVKFPHTDAPLCFSDDGALLVVGNGKTASVHDVSSRRQVHLLADHAATIRDITFAPKPNVAHNANTIVTASDDRTLKFWDAATGELRKSLPATASMRAVRFSPDGTILAFGGEDRAITLWDVTKHKHIRSESTGTPVDSIAFSPNGQLLACGCFGELKLFDAPSLKLIASFPLEARVTSVSFSPDGGNMAAVCLGGMARLINLKVMSDVGDLWDALGTSEWLLSVRFSPDGKTLATSGRVFGVRLFHSGN